MLANSLSWSYNFAMIFYHWGFVPAWSLFVVRWMTSKLFASWAPQLWWKPFAASEMCQERGWLDSPMQQHLPSISQSRYQIILWSEQIPGLAFAAIGFGNHNILLSRAALLMPLVLAAVQQTQPDSPEFLAQRLWEDKGCCWFASPLAPPCPPENSGALKIAVDAPRNSCSISTCFEHPWVMSFTPMKVMTCQQELVKDGMPKESDGMLYFHMFCHHFHADPQAIPSDQLQLGKLVGGNSTSSSWST